VFAIFPVLMVGFAIGGFVLSRQPELLAEIEERIKSTVSGDFGQQLISLMDSAIQSRTSVGVIGLATAAWAGLGWISNLREALSQMWGVMRQETPGFVRTKLSDLFALLGTFIAMVVTIALTVLGSSDAMKQVLEWLGIQDVPGISMVLRVVSFLMSMLVSWLLFTWIITRLPRESVSFRSSVRAGLIAAVGFEVFKQLGSIYLKSVVPGRRDLRTGAGPDGVRLHHRATDPVRDCMGGHVHRESHRRTGRCSRPGADHTPGADPRGFRGARGAHRCRGGSPWRAVIFAPAPTLVLLAGRRPTASPALISRQFRKFP
jgi:inner membrane protein YhjD